LGVVGGHQSASEAVGMKLRFNYINGSEEKQTALLWFFLIMECDGSGKDVGRSRDGGIDGIIKEDQLGPDAVYI
jgi:hypothetical protein